MSMTLIMLCILGVLAIVVVFVFIKDGKENARLEVYGGTAKLVNELLCAMNVDEQTIFMINGHLLKNKDECIELFFKNKKNYINYNYKTHAVYNMIKLARYLTFHSDLEQSQKETYKHIISVLYGIAYKHLPNNFDKNIFDINCNNTDSNEEEMVFYEKIKNLYIHEIIANEQYKKNPTNNMDANVKNVEHGLAELVLIEQSLEIILKKHVKDDKIKEKIINHIYEQKTLNLLLYDIEKSENTAFQCILTAVSGGAFLESQKLEKKQNLSNEEIYLQKELHKLNKLTFNEGILYNLRMKRKGKYNISMDEYILMHSSEHFDLIDIMILDAVDAKIDEFMKDYNVITDVKNLIIKCLNNEKDNIIKNIKNDKNVIITELIHSKIEVVSHSLYIIFETRCVGQRDVEVKNELARIKQILLKREEQKLVDEIFNNI